MFFNLYAESQPAHLFLTPISKNRYNEGGSDRGTAFCHVIIDYLTHSPSELT